MSPSWDMESFPAPACDMLVLINRWKARRSCLRFADKMSLDSETTARACARSCLSWDLALASDFVLAWAGVGGSPSEAFSSLGVESVVSDEADAETDCSAAAFLDICFRSRRLACRSILSLGAPVANSTRSGSTWNMSPGFRR